jgi:hypothetical protein
MYGCPKCPLVFGYNYSLKDHLMSHEKQGRKKLSCPNCKFTFLGRKHLRQHRTLCSKATPQPHDLDRFTCENCGRGFQTVRALEQHMGYNNTFTLQCSQCPKKFVHQNELDEHVQIDHATQEPEKKKEFECQKCKLTFSKKKSLKNHSTRCSEVLLRLEDIKLEPTDKI